MPTSFSLFTTQKPKPNPLTPSLSSSSSPVPSSSISTNKSVFENKYEQNSNIMSKSAFGSEVTSSSTTSSPVVIPTRGHQDGMSFDPRKERRQNIKKHTSTWSTRRPHNVHSPDAIPPSIAALLAITAIPPPKSNKRVRRQSAYRQRLTVDAVLQHTVVSEKELSITFGMSPMELLLSPPDESDSIDCSSVENGPRSALSSRSTSSESVPSLDESSLSDASTPPGSIITSSSRGRRALPTRRYQPSFLGEDTLHDHPLSDVDVEELDFRVFQRISDLPKEPVTGVEPPRRKSAFKSNLTASLRALKSAAKSLSSLTAPMMTPDDFLTRSIMSIDPRVPFTDERMPPLLADTPTPALRRYLNPTTNAPTDAHVPTSLTQTMSATQCTASIQMQTYKVSKSPRGSSPTGLNRRRQGNSEQAFADVASGPVARQRDMRENSDFIRIAVMEMAMRKNGKLDERKPGRARWALPPRKAPVKPYEIRNDGVPARWTALTY